MTDAETPETVCTLIPLADVDPALVEDVLDRAFGPGRFERTAYKVRGDGDWLPGLSFAAIEGDTLVGTIQTWPVALTDPQGKAHPLLMVGPVAVIPERQREGIGQALVLAMLGALDHPELQGTAPLPQVLIGDAEYYGRFFGFTAEATGGWRLPGPWEPHRLLVRAANPTVLPREGMLGPWRG